MSDEDHTPPEPALDAASLAEEYLDLWHANLKAMAEDPATPAAWQGAWTEALRAFSAQAEAMSALAASGLKTEAGNGADPSTTEPPPPHHSDGDRDVDVARLLQRLDDVEARLAALEGRDVEGRQSTPKPRRKTKRAGS